MDIAHENICNSADPDADHLAGRRYPPPLPEYIVLNKATLEQLGFRFQLSCSVRTEPSSISITRPTSKGGDGSVAVRYVCQSAAAARCQGVRDYGVPSIAKFVKEFNEK